MPQLQQVENSLSLITEIETLSHPGALFGGGYCTISHILPNNKMKNMHNMVNIINPSNYPNIEIT